MADIGQTFQTQRAMIVIVDTTGKVHAWDIGPGKARWEWDGISSTGQSMANVTLGGTFKRRTRDLQKMMKEMEA